MIAIDDKATPDQLVHSGNDTVQNGVNDPSARETVGTIAKLGAPQKSLDGADQIPYEIEKRRLEVEKLPLERKKLSAELRKLASERKKLLLERRSLHRQLSRYGEFREWLKAATVPAALIGVAATFFVGWRQVHEIQENRNADRFDKALTRLAGEKTSQRVTGVSGLRQFLFAGDEYYETTTLDFLVNAIATETEPAVQGIILDVIRENDVSKINQYIKDKALRAAVDRNRRLVREINERDDGAIELISRASKEERFRLMGLIELINVLILQGAQASDFSYMYCGRCDFGPAKRMGGANFQGSNLQGANFANVSLEGSNFQNAILYEANFYGANLSNADLRRSWAVDDNHRPAVLKCSNINGADFSNASIFTVIIEDNKTETIRGVSLKNALVDNYTKFMDLYFVTYNIKSTSNAYKISFDKTGEYARILDESGIISLIKYGTYPLILRYLSQPELIKSTSIKGIIDVFAKNIPNPEKGNYDYVRSGHDCEKAGAGNDLALVLSQPLLSSPFDARAGINLMKVLEPANPAHSLPRTAGKAGYLQGSAKPQRRLAH